MAGRKINYHPDSIDSEGRSFALIGLTIVSGLAAILFAFFLLDLGNLGPIEFLYIGLAASVPIGLAVLAFKVDKDSFAYDRASQIVNYNEPIAMLLVRLNPVIQKINISTEGGESNAVDEQRYEVVLEKDGQKLECIVKRRVYLPELSKEKENSTVNVFVDLTTDEVAAFKLEDNLYWAIPKPVLDNATK